MSKPSAKETLRNARKELAEKIQLRERTEIRIAQLRRMIAGMETYIEGSSKTPRLPGIGDVTLKGAIRTALRALGKPATIADIRAVLTELNYTAIEGHNNPTASVVNILRRLIKDGEVEEGQPREGKKTYVWILPVYGAASSLVNLMGDHERDISKRK
jgi:hypothetical protein